ncbi:hypothetical protein WMF04_24440 [Sorangium sp. So ce260]
MHDKSGKSEVGEWRRRDVVWHVTALGIFVALKGVVLVLGLGIFQR